jgi:ribosomal protein S20
VNDTYRTKVKTAREKYKKEVEAETDKIYANYTKAKGNRG